MKSKEEILNSYSEPDSSTYAAMDEYAEQMSIGFLKWVDENCVVSTDTEDKWDLIDWLPTETKSTAEQLYQLYIKHETLKS